MWVYPGKARARDVDSEGRPRTVIGILFSCPIHEDCLRHVPFNVFGGTDAPDTGPLWYRTGESFEDLTLTPSIKVIGGPEGCEWHGYITNGRLIVLDDSR